MKKKLVVLVMTMTMGLSMIACGKNDEVNNQDAGCGVCLEDDSYECNVESEDSYITADDEVLEVTVENEIEEISFSILDDGATVLEKLGDPASTEDNDNYHTNKYYNSAEVTYYTEGDSTEIVEFKSYSDAWKTSKGITIGSTVDEIKAAYGDPTCEYDSDNNEHCLDYLYTNGYSIYFTCNDNNEVILFHMAIGRG